MKKLILAAALFLFTTFSVSSKANSLESKSNWIDYQIKSNPNKISNTFEYVFKDGVWWIYEYDEDGRLVNIYPAE